VQTVASVGGGGGGHGVGGVCGGQMKQCVCTVGVGCSCCGWMAAAANCCCGPICGICTGVPGPGPGQFGLATTLQTCGSVIARQLAGRVGQQPTNMVLQVSLQIVAAVGWCPQPGNKVLQVSVQIVAAVGWCPQPGNKVLQVSVQNVPGVGCGQIGATVGQCSGALRTGHAGGTVCAGQAGGCVNDGQTKQWVCGVGWMAAAANCCCGPICGVCTGVPGPGPGQFGLATTLQICGCVSCTQKFACVCRQTFGCVGQLTKVQAIPALGHGGAKLRCGQAGGCVHTVAAVGQPMWVQPTMVQSTKVRWMQAGGCVQTVATVCTGQIGGTVGQCCGALRTGHAGGTVCTGQAGGTDGQCSGALRTGHAGGTVCTGQADGTDGQCSGALRTGHAGGTVCTGQAGGTDGQCSGALRTGHAGGTVCGGQAGGCVQTVATVGAGQFCVSAAMACA
jgi:hypothetical protein